MTYPIRPLPLGRSCSYRQRWRLARQLPRCGVGRPRRAPHGSHRRWGVLSAPAREVRPPTRRPRSARVLGQSSPEPAANARPRRPQAEPRGRSRHRVPLPTTGGSSLQKHDGQRGALPIPFAWTCGQSCAATARPPGSLPRHRPSRATRFFSSRGSPLCWSTSLVPPAAWRSASCPRQLSPRPQALRRRTAHGSRAVGGSPSLRPPAQVRATPHAELLHRPITHDCGLHAWASCVGRHTWGPGGMPPYPREGMS